MYKINVLGSNSSGNCIYVDTGDCKILLDAGLSCTKIKKKLMTLNVKMSDINYIFITHEHGDHIKGLEKILKTYNITIIGSRGTLSKFDNHASNIIYVRDKEKIQLKNLEVLTTQIIHDTIEPTCFSITNSLGEKMLYLTDCGIANHLQFKNYDCYIIEANYSLKILKENFSNKKIPKIRYYRALSGTGHLSIEETIRFLNKNIGGKTKHIILSHLSSQNANEETFKNKAKNELFFQDVDIAKEGLEISCGEEFPFI